MKYLYGAAVQGIQGFIFQTNELKDIVGASELVENICTVEFAKMLYGSNLGHDKLLEQLKNDDNTIINAAGNIKYIFDETEKAICEKVVKEFPKKVVIYAPGITISQAVVSINDNDKFSECVDKLESRLCKQRNMPMASTTIGLMGIERSRKTGLPVVEEIDDEFLDDATFNKRYHKIWDGTHYRKRTTRLLCCKAFGKNIRVNIDNLKDSEIAFDIEKITDRNDWIAVIHADGNGLGQVVQKVGKEPKTFKAFSKKLDEATVKSAVDAFNAIKERFSEKKIIPIRPIVLGGDDFTVICRADLAMDYIKTYIRQFEENTHDLLGSIIEDKKVFEKGKVRDRLTACAGIAYIKSSYPFYYGYELAESLCTKAKKDAKDDDEVRAGKALPPSCIMFHKVQDSFVENFDDIAARELTAKNNISFEFGPYYLHNDVANAKKRWTVNELEAKAEHLDSKEGNAMKSHLRNWLTLLVNNPGMAGQKLDRMKDITSKDMNAYIDEVTKDAYKRKKDDVEMTVYPVYDILAIHTINNQVTK